MRKFLPVFLFFSSLAPAMAAVRVWASSLTLPTYAEQAADPNPPFDLLKPALQNYPYTLRNDYSKNRSNKAWRTLELENEYLKCIILPDLGGRVYTCVDKINHREMFYANTVVKKADMAYRGAWWAAGTENNFPVGHHWTTVSPVDFATSQNPDGSASVFVGNTDLVEGLRWVVENILRPGSSILEQHVTLSNPTSLRRRYLWWNNAGVEAATDTRFYYPAHLTAAHGLADIETWPVNRAGVDMSALSNHTEGRLARFTYGCREPFMGIYSRLRDSGTVHYADPGVMPGKKLWSWGAGAFGAEMSKQLTDDGTIYVEMQAGLFENQETFALLEPRQSIAFTEYWMPVRGLGGITRSTLDAAVYVEKINAPSRPAVKLALNAFHPIAGAKIRVTEGDKVLLDEKVDLSPPVVFSRTILNPVPESKYRIELLDAAGKLLLTHTEDQWNAALPSEVKLGDQSKHGPAPASQGSEAEALSAGTDLEQKGNLLEAAKSYQLALGRLPASSPLLKAAGRVLVTLMRYDDAMPFLIKAAGDLEARYYLGIAYARSENDAKARPELEAALADKVVGAAAAVELAYLLSRAGEVPAALKALQSSSPLEVALLRRMDDKEQAIKRLQYWLQQDPTGIVPQVEVAKLGGPSAALWRHLAASPDRVLDAAVFYMNAGLFPDALSLLGHQYAAADSLETEPGAVLPQDHPLVSYYRGFCRRQTGGDGQAEFALASSQSTLYVFPHRPETFRVLQAALKANPTDATAHFLLGSLQMSAGRAEQAASEWQQASRLNPKFSSQHATLAHALSTTAATVNPVTPDKPAPKLTGTAPEIASLALALVESGRLQEAGAIFTERNFPNEKQSPAVREAFVEVRLESLFALAKAKRCAEALAQMETIGDEDKSLPFTLYGFGAILKSPRLQYSFALVEELCGNDKAARKRWGRIAKLAGGQPSLDSVFGHLASARLSSDKPGLRPVLDQVIRARRDSGSNQPELAYVQGLLELALGNQKDAQASFQNAVEHAAGDIILLHLAQMGLLGR